MRRLAELLGDMAEAPHAMARRRRLEEYFSQPDPDFGWSIAWLANALKPPRQTPAKLRKLAESRVDAELFRLSAAAIGDVAETAALIWPGAGDLPVGEAANAGEAPGALFDRLDAEARVALARLLTGRKAKGVKPREVHLSLATVFSADPDLIAGALISEAPPYPRLCAWLTGEGPAPNWAPPKPPDLPHLTAAPDAAFDAWPLPDGDPVAVAEGRAFDASGGEVKVSEAAAQGWGFCRAGEVFFHLATEPLADSDAARASGASLLIRFRRTESWAIWPAASRSVICPVTFIEAGRTVTVTLGVRLGDEIAPLAKLPAPEASKVAAFARRAMTDKFGPVRQVGPGLWAELEYHTIRPAPRRKIGVTLEGARIARLIWEDGPAAPDLSEIT